MAVSDLAIWILWAAPIFFGIALVAFIAETFRTDTEEPEFSEIGLWLQGLHRNGHYGQSVLFSHLRTGRFVRFEKQADGGITLTFPEIRWGRDLLANLQAYCDDHGLLLRHSTNENARGTEYARVDLGSDVQAALAISLAIWTGFYGYGPRERHLRSCSDYSTVSELTRVPPQVADREVQARRSKGYLNAQLKQAGLAWLGTNGFIALTASAGLGMLVASFGLPLSTVLSVADAPEWHFAMGQVEAGGSIVSLALFITYVLSFAVFRRIQRRPVAPRGKSAVGQVVDLPLLCLRIAIPVAVIVIWLGL